MSFVLWLKNDNRALSGRQNGLKYYKILNFLKENEPIIGLLSNLTK